MVIIIFSKIILKGQILVLLNQVLVIAGCLFFYNVIKESTKTHQDHKRA